MHYDFESIMERAGHDAMALDALGKAETVPDAPKAGFDAIPMWVADMNFPTCPSVVDAMRTRLDHPAFGYFMPRAEYFDAIAAWHERRHGVQGICRRHIGYENGVLGGLISTICAFTAPGDAVLVHSPTYIGFTNSITNAGRKLVRSPLVRDADGVWRMDYADMEEKLARNNIHVAVFCSPHNPTGRVWQRDELERAMEVFAKHNCVVVSDEIWSDLVMPGQVHIPTQSVSDDARSRTVALYAPSKTFNLAGLVGSYHIIYDDYLRDRVLSQSSKCHYNDMNVLSMHALIGAYSDEGAAWVDQLCGVLSENIDAACVWFAAHAPEVRFAKPQGTYMLFLDCSAWCETYGKTIEELLRAGWDVGVAWQDGRPFGGSATIRMNLALPRTRVQEALDRLETYVFV